MYITPPSAGRVIIKGVKRIIDVFRNILILPINLIKSLFVFSVGGESSRKKAAALFDTARVHRRFTADMAFFGAAT